MYRIDLLLLPVLALVLSATLALRYDLNPAVSYEKRHDGGLYRLFNGVPRLSSPPPIHAPLPSDLLTKLFALVDLSTSRRGAQASPRQGHDTRASSPRLASGIPSALEGRSRKAFGDAVPTKTTLGVARLSRPTGIPSIRGKLDSEISGLGDKIGADEPCSTSPMPPPPPPPQAFDKSSTDREMETLRARATEATR